MPPSAERGSTQSPTFAPLSPPAGVRSATPPQSACSAGLRPSASATVAPLLGVADAIARKPASWFACGGVADREAGGVADAVARKPASLLTCGGVADGWSSGEG